MAEYINRQDAINVVAQLYRYESDRMTALQEIPSIQIKEEYMWLDTKLLHEQFGKELPVFRKNEWCVYMKNKVHNFLNQHNTLDIIKAVLILDDEDGLSNWDYYEEESLEKAIAGINGGYGILKVNN